MSESKTCNADSTYLFAVSRKLPFVDVNRSVKYVWSTMYVLLSFHVRLSDPECNYQHDSHSTSQYPASHQPNALFADTVCLDLH